MKAFVIFLMVFVYYSDGVPISEWEKFKVPPSEICAVHRNATQRNDSAVARLLDMLCTGEEKLLPQGDGELVAVVGRTGTGKTFLVESLAEIKENKGVKLFPPKENITIGKDTTLTSDTFLPGVYFHNTTNMIYIDCPGFEDTRGADYDISNAHFIKTMLSRGKKVKLVVVEKYSNLIKRPSPEKNALLTLLRHVSAMIKGNISKFEDNIVLIASQVVGEVDKVPGNEIIDNVVKFLTDAQANPSLPNDQKNIIQALLKKPNGRIGYTRYSLEKPEASEKNKLEDMIKTLTFENIQPGDFDYTVSDTTLLGIYTKLLAEITTSIQGSINAMSESIIEHYKKRKNDFEDEAAGQFAAAYAYLLGVKRELKRSNDLENLAKNIWDVGKILDVEIDSQVISDIKLHAKHISFLQNVSHDNVTAAKTWSTDFAAGALEFLYQPERWFMFKTTLHTLLISEAVQNNRRNYNISDRIASIDKLLRTETLEFSIRDIKVYDFLHTNFPTFTHFWEKDPMISHAQLKELRNILSDDLAEKNFIGKSTETSIENPNDSGANSIAPQYIGMWTGLLVLIHVLCTHSFVR